MIRYFFVCGAPKSGTTWLQRLLDSHPSIACSGEGHFIELFYQPLIQVIEHYKVHAEKVADQVYSGAPFYEPVSLDLAAQTARTWAIAMMSKRRTENTTHLGDKTPIYTQGLRELKGLFPEAKILAICRDPRDVAVSRLFHAARAGYSEALIRGSEFYRNQVAVTVASWSSANERIALHARHLPDDIIQVRYEDLISDPLAEASRLFAFLGADSDVSTVQAAVERSSFRQLSGRDPGDEDQASFFRKGVVGDWATHLDAAALRTIAEGCGKQMKLLGYVF